MQVVSNEFKESMTSALRNRAYIKVVFGFDSTEIQNKASISGDMTSHSIVSDIFKQGTDNFVYASIEEEDFTVIDQGLLFPPSFTTYNWKEKAFISAELVSDTPAVVTISFSDLVRITKMMINFGDNYPLDFDITNDTDTYEVRNNDQRIVEIDHDFGTVNELILTVTSMKKPNTRLRIYSIDFASFLFFENDKVIDSNLRGSMSPINKTLPQRNFTVNLVNENHQFDLDNPKSELDVLKTSTVITIHYGYQLDDGTIEWIKYSGLYCYTWDANEDQATITGRDILQTVEKKYIDGTFSSISLYDLAESVLSEMGITDYHLDEDMQDMLTTNPLPVTDCKECLQIIANAACKKFLLQSDGGIAIGEENNLTLDSNGDLYGKLDTILIDEPKYSYASLENNFIEIDNDNILFPPNYNYLDVGFVSTNASKSSGYFTGSQADLNDTDDVLNGNLAVLSHTFTIEDHETAECPYIEIVFTEVVYFTGMRLDFGLSICEIFEIELIVDDTVIKTHTITGNQLKSVLISFDIYQMDKIRIRFVKTCKPRNRVRIDYIELFKVTGYIISQNDIIGSAKFEKFPQIQQIIVPYYNYQAELEESKLAETELADVDLTTVYTIQVTEPCTSYRLSVSAGTVTIVDSSAYWVKFKFASIADTNPTVILYGKKHNRIERTYTKNLNDYGEIVRWENPLVNSQEMAERLADFVSDYYGSLGTYSFESRGDPQLEVNDIVKQEHYTGKNLDVLITDINLGFNGAFSGNITTLRLGG